MIARNSDMTSRHVAQKSHQTTSRSREASKVAIVSKTVNGAKGDRKRSADEVLIGLTKSGSNNMHGFPSKSRTTENYQKKQLYKPVSTRSELKATATSNRAAVAAIAPSSSFASVSVGAASLPSNSLTSSETTMQAIIDQEASRGGNSQEEFLDQQRAVWSSSSIANFAAMDDGGGKLPATSSTINVSTTLLICLCMHIMSNSHNTLVSFRFV